MPLHEGPPAQCPLSWCLGEVCAGVLGTLLAAPPAKNVPTEHTLKQEDIGPR